MKISANRPTGGMKSLPIPRTLRRFLQQSAAWTVICFAIELFCYFVLHLRAPYDYHAGQRQFIFIDFTPYIHLFANFHSRSFFDPFRLMYPAPAVVSYRLLLLGGGVRHPHFATWRFVGIMVATSWILMLLVGRSLVRRGLAPRSTIKFLLATYFLSFPFWFEVHQANLEFVVWIVIIVGLWAFWTDRSYLAAAMFGVAISMKIFPFMYLGLLVARKEFRQAVFALFVTGATTITSLWLVCPDIRYSLQQTNIGVDLFRKMYVLGLRPLETGYDHSLFCLFKRMLPRLPRPHHFQQFFMAYAVVAAICGFYLFFTRIRKLPVVNQILCLSVAAILLPPTSYDYTLLHLYAPFVLLVFVLLEQTMKGSDKTLPGIPLAFALFAFLLSAQEEFIYHGLRYAGQLKAIALLALFAVALRYPFRSRVDLQNETQDTLKFASY